MVYCRMVTPLHLYYISPDLHSDPTEKFVCGFCVGLKIGHYLHTVDNEELSAAYLKITCFECHFAAASSLRAVTPEYKVLFYINVWSRSHCDVLEAS